MHRQRPGARGRERSECAGALGGRFRIAPWLAALGIAATMAAAGGAADLVPGPVRARVLEVIDGDTIVVRARIWIDQSVKTRVRIDGVDAPEISGGCPEERVLARRARAILVGEVGNSEVVLSEIRFGKFGGRVIARVHTAAGDEVAKILIEAGLGRPYDGGSRASWCGP